ncbi:AraC family transcriptional regulator [Streptomyces sp. NPDC047081]|uniref:AraC family transcriptional regulator n=1 Tax=Streptomyces sp. NPDC047081 TaxID=3154706 RepID=UPI003410CC19
MAVALGENQLLPLSRHVQVCTGDPVQAEYEASRVWAVHHLRPDWRHSFAIRLHGVEVGSSTLAYHAYDGGGGVDFFATHNYYLLNIVVDGGVEVTSRGATVCVPGGSAYVMSPHEQVRIMLAPQTTGIMAKIPRSTLEEAFGRLSGESVVKPVEFAVLADPDAAWQGCLRSAVAAVDHCDSGIVPAQLGSEIERMVVTSLLMSQRHDAQRALFRPGRSRGSRAADVAAQAMAADPEKCWEITELAEYAGVSLRTLQEGFKGRFGRSPSAYLRGIRLERAHRMLGDSDEAGTLNVTEIAYACGFNHPGRFAIAYRDRYGVSPSTTLAASRTALAAHDE